MRRAIFCTWALAIMAWAATMWWPQTPCQAPQPSWCGAMPERLEFQEPGLRVRASRRGGEGGWEMEVEREGKTVRFVPSQAAAHRLEAQWFPFAGARRMIHPASLEAYGFAPGSRLTLQGGSWGEPVEFVVGTESYGNRFVYSVWMGQPQTVMLWDPDGIRELRQADRRMFEANPWASLGEFPREVTLHSGFAPMMRLVHHEHDDQEIAYWQVAGRPGRSRSLGAWMHQLLALRGTHAVSGLPAGALRWVVAETGEVRVEFFKHQGEFFATFGPHQVGLGPQEVLERLPGRLRTWRHESPEPVPVRGGHVH